MIWKTGHGWIWATAFTMMTILFPAVCTANEGGSVSDEVSLPAASGRGEDEPVTEWPRQVGIEGKKSKLGFCIYPSPRSSNSEGGQGVEETETDGLNLTPPFPSAEKSDRDTAFAFDRPEMRVRIRIENPEDALKVGLMNLEAEYREDDRLYLNITGVDFVRLQEAGFNPVVVVEDLEAERQLRREYARFIGCRNYQEMRREILDIVNLYPEIAQAFIIGESVQGRDIITVKISDNVRIDELEPEISWDGAIHGDEPLSMELALFLIRELTEGYLTTARITELVNNREIWITPCINPDGMEIYERRNANNVDLNRNFGYMWKDHDGPASDHPYSQPETQALLGLMLGNQFAVGVNGHTGAEMFIYPWGYAAGGTPSLAEHATLADRYSERADYEWGVGWYTLMYNWGTLKDGMPGIAGTLGFCLEIARLGQEFPPPTQKDYIAYYCERNREAAWDLIEQAGRGISGTVTDRFTGEAVPAIVYLNDLPGYVDPVIGDFHRYCIPGFHSATVWANGYEPLAVPLIQVPPDSTTDIDLKLDTRSGLSYAYRIIYVFDSRYFNPEEYECPPPDPFHAPYSHGLNVLGPVDGDYYSLGEGGYLVVDMGEESIIHNVSGPDFTVWEGDGSPEGYEVQVAQNWQGPWYSVGEGEGTQDFSLEFAPLSWARYVKIIDDEDGDPCEDDPGFDLDAVTAGYVMPSCGILNLDGDSYFHTDEMEIQLLDADLNLDPSEPDIASVTIIPQFNRKGPQPVFTVKNSQLTETGANTGEFRTTIELASLFPGIEPAGSIRVTYHDTDCQGGLRTVIAIAGIRHLDEQAPRSDDRSGAGGRINQQKYRSRESN